MIRVFKTNVLTSEEAEFLLTDVIIDALPQHKVTFDIEDCDKILRIEGEDFDAELVVVVLSLFGFFCEELE